MADELSPAEARLTAALESVSDGFYALDADWRYVIFNRAAEEYFGVTRDVVLGQMMWEVFPQGRGTPFEAACFAARDEGLVTTFETPSRLRPDRTVELRIAPMAGGGVSVALNDITRRKENEERLQLLAREVDHRANNLLAVVQSAVSLTNADTVEDFKLALSGRIAALARAHQLLADGRWEGADLATLARDELRPYGGAEADGGPRRIRIEGPSLPLPPAAAQALAMALHELATNAAKHGALSTPGGRIAIAWRRDEAGALVLDWTETGGPAVSEPTRQGFGAKVLARALGGSLGGGTALMWPAEGLKCRLTLPLKAEAG